MTFEIVFVLLGLLGMVVALVLDKMRPGMVLFSVVVLFLCAGILTPKEMLEGFSNKGMITVAMLFLVSEGIRQSGALGQVIKKLLPQGKTTVFKAQLRMLPAVAFISAFLNNTPVVVIFAPIIKRWAEAVKLPATKFLIPLSYVTILGGICTLIGTSTNLVVHGMILEAGYEGFSMFELGKVGIFIAIAGLIYLFLFSSKLLPDVRQDVVKSEDEQEENGALHPVEAILGSRFPGINKKLGVQLSAPLWSCRQRNQAERTEHQREFGERSLSRRRHVGGDGRRFFHPDLGRVFRLRHAGEWQRHGTGDRKGETLVCPYAADSDDHRCHGG